jgi:HEAT repeat protein
MPQVPRLRLALTALLLVASPAALQVATADVSRSVLEAASALSRHPQEVVRQKAAAALAEAKTPEDQDHARQALVGALRDPATAVRRQAAVTLIQLPTPSLGASLAQALAHERDRTVVTPLLLALGALEDPGTLPMLETWLRDPAVEVRAAALSAVGEAGGERARSVLLAALLDPGGPDPAWQVRAAAVLGLARVGQPGDAARVREAMDATQGWSSWFARSAYAKAVPVIEVAPRPVLERLLLDPDERVAVTAALSVARLEGEPGLLALLSHAAGSVRAAAAGACGQLVLQAARRPLTAIAYRDREVRTRWAAALALFRMNAPEADEMVLAGLASREATVWAEAVAALEQRTGARHGNDAAAWRRELEQRRGRGGR